MFTVILTVDFDGTLARSEVDRRHQNHTNAVQIYRMNKSQARLDPPLGLKKAGLGGMGVDSTPW
jgi:hypothetical protein